ncbi:MAG: type II secretion system protein [Patescibacteria group bacterium]
MSINQKKQTKKGFTLIEMIVVIAIIATVTVIVLFNSGRLNSAILVSNTAYEIGLIVRESQVAGLGVRATTDGGNVGFNTSHGVFIDRANPTQVILFADKNGNGMYDSVAGEMTQEYNIQNKRAGTILSICAKRSDSVGPCTTTTNTYTVADTVSVVFTRPNPEAFFTLTRPASAPEIHMGTMVITVGFPNDMCRSIAIEKTGAVQVDSTYCPVVIN